MTHPLSSAEISILLLENSSFCYFEKYLLIVLTFFWVLKSCFNKHDCNVDDVSEIGNSWSP